MLSPHDCEWGYSHDRLSRLEHPPLTRDLSSSHRYDSMALQYTPFPDEKNPRLEASL